MKWYTAEYSFPATATKFARLMSFAVADVAKKLLKILTNSRMALSPAMVSVSSRCLHLFSKVFPQSFLMQCLVSSVSFWSPIIHIYLSSYMVFYIWSSAFSFTPPCSTYISKKKTSLSILLDCRSSSWLFIFLQICRVPFFSCMNCGQIEAAKNQLAQSSSGRPGTAVSPDLCPSTHNQAL